MDDSYSTQKLLALRKLTRTVGEVLGEQMRVHIETLTPLFRQRSVLGEHVQGYGKEPAQEADQAFKELEALYDTVAVAAPFHLPKGLKSPLMQMTLSLELTPWEYTKVVEADGASKKITVTYPFKRVLNYAGYAPRRLRELLAGTTRNDGELQQFVLHYLVMHLVVSKRPGLVSLLEALHFPLGSTHLPGLGTLPVTTIASSIGTHLPPNSLVIQSTDLSGKDAFEELINVGDVNDMTEPLKERLSGILK